MHPKDGCGAISKRGDGAPDVPGEGEVDTADWELHPSVQGAGGGLRETASVTSS